MSDTSPTALTLLAALFAGAGLGLLFFGGLWWTVRRLPGSDRPGLLLGGSFLLRTALVVGGFWLVMGASWQRAAACLLGFLLARTLLVRPAAAAASTRGGAGPRGREACGADDG